MGVGSAGLISRRLIEGGLPANTPVAVVENGTLPDQRGAVGRLGALRSLIRATGIEGPAIVFVGDTAAEASIGSEVPRQLAQVG
jgi:uroporphyrin-III C-methyltransferase/precorrin-2 dehydrogenase/sirohydrochlorin ferrochelatase